MGDGNTISALSVRSLLHIPLKPSVRYVESVPYVPRVRRSSYLVVDTTVIKGLIKC